jgi:hypothetical protein
MDRLGKCQGRPDVACVNFGADPTGNPVAACYPLCSQDSQCPSGRRCDPNSAMCVDTLPPGDPFGAHCTSNPDAGTDTCQGLCLALGNGTSQIASICTKACVLGELQQCDWVGAGMSLAGNTHGVCVYGVAAARPGDLGFCAQLCDTAANCSDQTDPGVTCDMTNIPVDVVGHGACFWQ